MPKPKVIDTLQSRQAMIDKAVSDATAPGKKKKAPAPKNPYPAGSASAKYWARRQREGTKMKKTK